MLKVFIFLWYKVLSIQISHSQVKNCDQQLETKKDQCYIRKKSKCAYKKRKHENFEKQKDAFLSHIPRITQPKNQVPSSKCVLCSLLTDRWSDRHESEYRGRPFKVSGIFLSSKIDPIHNSIQFKNMFTFCNSTSVESTTLLYLILIQEGPRLLIINSIRCAWN